MNKNKKKEELQTRREFFKKAAKKALPLLGAFALASSPIIAQAASKTPMGCGYTCEGSCSGGCEGTCKLGCELTCKGTCEGGCQNTCTGGCRWSCKGSCEKTNR